MNFSDQTRSLKLKAHAFTRFKPGWSFGEGIAIPTEVADRIESLILLAEQNECQADLFPGLDGEIAIAVYCESPEKDFHCIEVIAYPGEDRYDVSVERGKGPDPTHLVSGTHFTEANAVEMLTAWMDIVRSGRSHKPDPIKVF